MSHHYRGGLLEGKAVTTFLEAAFAHANSDAGTADTDTSDGDAITSNGDCCAPDAHSDIGTTDTYDGCCSGRHH